MTSKTTHPLDFKSHRDRRLSRSIFPLHYHKTRQRYVDTIKEGPNNVMIKESKVVTFKPSDELSSYKVSDFSLENLQAIGASLNTSFLTSHDTTNIIDKMTTTLSNLDSINVNDK